MATRKKTATEETTEVVEETATETVAETAAESTAEKSYAYSALKKDCRKLFKVPTITFVAATGGLDQSKKYTISEVSAIIAAWGAKEVK